MGRKGRKCVRFKCVSGKGHSKGCPGRKVRRCAKFR